MQRTSELLKSTTNALTTSSGPNTAEEAAKATLERFFHKAIEVRKNVSPKPIVAVGVGSPCMDLTFNVSEEFLERHNLKSGTWQPMENLGEFEKLLKAAYAEDPSPLKKTGGSSSNTMKVLAKLQASHEKSVAFIGKLGKDEFAEFYRGVVQRLKMHLLTEASDKPMTRIAVFVTPPPNGNRTFVCSPSRSLDLSPEVALSKNPFKNVKSAHFEGYMIEEFSLEFIQDAMREAKKAEATVSYDLGSAKLIKDHRAQVLDLLKNVDIVFANESEAQALMGISEKEEDRAKSDPEFRESINQKAARKLSSYPYCTTAVILKGDQGSLVSSRDTKPFTSPPSMATPVDSNGCGDAFIGGFLHGKLLGRSLEECAWIGNLMGGAMVSERGAEIPAYRWPYLIKEIQNYLVL